MKNLQEYKKHLGNVLAQFKNKQDQQLSLIKDYYKKQVYQSELNSYHSVLSKLDKAVEIDLQKQMQPNPKLEVVRDQYKDVPHLLKMAEKTYGHENDFTKRAVMEGNIIIKGFTLLNVSLLQVPS